MHVFFFFQQFCFAFFLESITWIVSCGRQSWSWPLQKSAKPSTAPVGLVLLIALYVHGQWFPSTALDASYFLRPCIHPATCSSVSFPLWHGDACPCDSEGGETVTHTNASRQLCVCVSLSRFLCARAFKHRQLSFSVFIPRARRGPDTVPPWHRNLLHPWAALWPENQKNKEISSVEGHEEYPFHHSELITVA